MSLGSSPAGGARKKHFERSAFFNEIRLRRVKFVLRASEIAPLWNICFANVGRRISFHIERSEIFHNFRKKIISHSPQVNISLERRKILCYNEDKKGGGCMKKLICFFLTIFVLMISLTSCSLIMIRLRRVILLRSVAQNIINSCIFSIFML